MVYLVDLWLPILLSAVFVFLASWVLHMLLTYHRSDYNALPNGEAVADLLRPANMKPGTYMYPHCADPKDMAKPEVQEKFKAGPVMLTNVFPSGPPSMGKSLGIWFVYCVLISVFAGYLAGRTLGPGTHYLAVFRIVGTTAFLAFGVGEASNSIWRGQLWGVTAKHMFDGLVYALLTAGTFGWLWP
jgi:hypothetical protein